jgi:hypothetical protein
MTILCGWYIRVLGVRDGIRDGLSLFVFPYQFATQVKARVFLVKSIAMRLFTQILLALSLVSSPVIGLTPQQWKSQSIYQVLTDRFARTDGSTTATCNTGDQIYCGGTWQGIINHLDYIQNMGFTAVSFSSQ